MRKLSVTLYAPCLMCIPESYDKSKIKKKYSHFDKKINLIRTII